MKSPSGKEVYEAIRHEGEEELERTSSALAFSGLAAGLSMGFSFLGPAMIHAHLPETHWRTLVVAFGYTLGFLIVVLGRQQLFTENTLTVILPLLSERRRGTPFNIGRVWIVVLIANAIGAILFAWVVARTEAVDPAVHEAMFTLARGAQHHGFAVTLLRGIFAGWLVALMVWVLPFAESARVWMIIIITWIIGAGHFSHVIVGVVDSSFLLFIGESTFVEAASKFFASLIGNIIGGVTLVAALNHAQVKA